MTTVVLKDLGQLERAIVKLGKRIEEGIAKASFTAASWGVGRATRDTIRAGAVATHTAAQSWIARRVGDGAILANSAEHFIFVEGGRRPGRKPPLQVVEEWIDQKRIKPRVNLGPGITGDVYGGRRKLRVLLKERKRSRQWLAKRALAFTIQGKIGRKGVKGRFILKNMLKALELRWYKAMRRELQAITLNPPR